MLQQTLPPPRTRLWRVIDGFMVLYPCVVGLLLLFLLSYFFWYIHWVTSEEDVLRYTIGAVLWLAHYWPGLVLPGLGTTYLWVRWYGRWRRLLHQYGILRYDQNGWDVEPKMHFARAWRELRRREIRGE